MLPTSFITSAAFILFPMIYFATLPASNIIYPIFGTASTFFVKLPISLKSLFTPKLLFYTFPNISSRPFFLGYSVFPKKLEKSLIYFPTFGTLLLDRSLPSVNKSFPKPFLSVLF
jgi:hypothetical protein